MQLHACATIKKYRDSDLEDTFLHADSTSAVGIFQWISAHVAVMQRAMVHLGPQVQWTCKSQLGGEVQMPQPTTL